MKTNNAQEQDNKAVNYFFLLKCMAAVTTAAVVTAMFLAGSLKSSGAIGATSMAKTALTATVYAPTPILPLVAATFLIIGSICLIPLLYHNSRYSERRQRPGARVEIRLPGTHGGCCHHPRGIFFEHQAGGRTHQHGGVPEAGRPHPSQPHVNRRTHGHSSEMNTHRH